MPYYSESDIEKINEVDIRQVLNKLDVEYDARSKKYRCPNPNHTDTHPSMSVKDNYWNCFSCGAGGNVINLVMTVYGINFQQACEWIIANFNLSISHHAVKAKKYKPKKKQRAAIVTTSAVITAGDETILSYIVANAALSPDARDFLFSQRKFSPEIVQKLRLGSISNDDRFWAFLNKQFSRERLTRSNIVIPYAYRDYVAWQAPCVLFPFYDIEGRLINIISRRIDACEPKDKFRSVTGVGTIPYNLPILNTMEDGETLCIMEGLTDTVAALSNGWKAIGLHGCTNKLVDYRNEISRFNLVYYHDNDDAGRKSFEKRKKELSQYFIPLDEGKIDMNYKDFSAYYAAATIR